MKKFIAATAIFFTLGFSAFAEEKETVSCKDLSELAGQIMELRQAEVPMSKLMEAMGGEPTLEEIVVIAYSKPSFQGKEFIERQVAEYKNEVYRHCFKATRNK